MKTLEMDLAQGPSGVMAGPMRDSKGIYLNVWARLPDGTGQGAAVELDAREALRLSQFLFGAACDAMGLDLALEVAKR